MEVDACSAAGVSRSISYRPQTTTAVSRSLGSQLITRNRKGTKRRRRHARKKLLPNPKEVRRPHHAERTWRCRSLSWEHWDLYCFATSALWMMFLPHGVAACDMVIFTGAAVEAVMEHCCICLGIRLGAVTCAAYDMHQQKARCLYSMCSMWRFSEHMMCVSPHSLRVLFKGRSGRSCLS